jgi:uncharacterized protein
MKARAVADYKTTCRTMKNLKKIQPRNIDNFFHSQHQKEFMKIDCLECANCCCSISPAMHDVDVKRMASFSKMKTADFIDAYLTTDEEGDYVFRKTPCPFLGHDNYCSIYPSRPKACREYPHTDRNRIYQILDLTAKNSKVCPAVHNIVESLKKSPPAFSG